MAESSIIRLQDPLTRNLTNSVLENKKVKEKLSRYLLVPSQYWKHQKNLWNLFKVNSKDTRTTLLTLLLYPYC